MLGRDNQRLEIIRERLKVICLRLELLQKLIAQIDFAPRSKELLLEFGIEPFAHRCLLQKSRSRCRYLKCFI